MPSLQTVAFASLLSTATAASGWESHCVGPRLHRIDYDMSDDMVNGTPSSFNISMMPLPEESQGNCSQPTNGETSKAVCVGMNTLDCMVASQSIRISDFLDCSNCFLGITTDIFFNYQVSWFKLKSLSLGLKNTHLRGAIEVQAHEQASATVAHGKIPIITDKHEKNINFVVAGIIPVNINLKLPVDLSYAVTLSESIDATIGGDVDVQLGDHSVSWDPDNGVRAINTPQSVTWSPALGASGSVRADVPLALESTLEVTLERIMEWNLHITPGMTLHAEADVDTQTRSDKLCLSGDTDFSVTHDVDIDFKLPHCKEFSLEWGPWDIYTKHWDDVFHKCIDIDAEGVKDMSNVQLLV